MQIERRTFMQAWKSYAEMQLIFLKENQIFTFWTWIFEINATFAYAEKEKTE